jgi:DeoR/GlpR family transcriptional regulator of sugar metabolism
VRSLSALSGITIITNTVNVAMELSNRKDINVIVTGGHPLQTSPKKLFATSIKSIP